MVPAARAGATAQCGAAQHTDWTQQHKQAGLHRLACIAQPDQQTAAGPVVVAPQSSVCTRTKNSDPIPTVMAFRLSPRTTSMTLAAAATAHRPLLTHHHENTFSWPALPAFTARTAGAAVSAHHFAGRICVRWKRLHCCAASLHMQQLHPAPVQPSS